MEGYRKARAQRIFEKASKGKGVVNKPKRERKSSSKKLRGKFDRG